MPCVPNTNQRLRFQLLEQLPKTVDPKTITLSNAPNGGDSKRLGDIVNFKVGQIGLKYVIRAYAALSSLTIAYLCQAR